MGFEKLSSTELNGLIRRVFRPTDHEREIAIFVDLPDAHREDHPAWAERRTMARGWADAVAAGGRFKVSLVVYPNVRANNADLPASVWEFAPGHDLPDSASELDGRHSGSLGAVLNRRPLILAPTELSATAPLKVLARQYGFRAATMAGFSAAMIPALRLDYAEVNRRVELFKFELDRAVRAEFLFIVSGTDEHHLSLDLRHRTAHASGGLLHQPGTAGNLPSGEAYIVPYEGENPGDASRSAGSLPVQLDGEIVVYTIRGNKAVEATGSGDVARREAALIRTEPAYANLAELGLGVLGALGVQPVGEVLLDEKLGLHIAFGRSEHFGGMIGPDQFSSPEAVTHQDRVYLPELQPDVIPQSVVLFDERDDRIPLMLEGRWVYPF